MKPVYAEVGEDEAADAWLERDDRRVPLKRVVDELEVEPVVFPNAPRMGAEARAARQIGDRLADVRIAAAVLQGAVEKAELEMANQPWLFGRLVRPRPWIAPAIAAREPLQRIVEACAAFEDALANEPLEIDRAPEERTRAMIERAAAIRPVAEAINRAAPIIAAVEAVNRIAPAIAAVGAQIAAVAPQMEVASQAAHAVAVGACSPMGAEEAEHYARDVEGLRRAAERAGLWPHGLGHSPSHIPAKP